MRDRIIRDRAFWDKCIFYINNAPEKADFMLDHPYLYGISRKLKRLRVCTMRFLHSSSIGGLLFGLRGRKLFSKSPQAARRQK